MISLCIPFRVMGKDGQVNRIEIVVLLPSLQDRRGTISRRRTLKTEGCSIENHMNDM
jgi:hypothetical protein